jgi:hypothetical protein
MLRRRDLKILLRSRSWDFVKNYKKTAHGSQGLYRWNGEPNPLKNACLCFKPGIEIRN